MESETPMIEVRELTKVFGRFVAVDRVTFSVNGGEIFGFLGPNGAGKSTTIRMLCGLLRSSSGTGIVAGYDINRDPEGVRRRIGYMSQRFSLYRDLTVRENIAFFGGVYGVRGKRLKARSQEIIAMAGLSGLERQLTGTLSGALQQRLALGCAILHEPQVLFLDEPTSGVDPISRRLFWDTIQTMATQGRTILVTTHFMDEAEFCERIGFISKGKLIALDTPARLKSDSVHEDLFEVAMPVQQESRRRLEEMEDVVATSYFGQCVHVFCRQGAYRSETLASRMRAMSLDVQAVDPAPVRLEDVFIRLVQEQAQGEAAKEDLR